MSAFPVFPRGARYIMLQNVALLALLVPSILLAYQCSGCVALSGERSIVCRVVGALVGAAFGAVLAVPLGLLFAVLFGVGGA